MVENNQTKSKVSKESKRGGSRANAGRKAGAATKKTREIANKAAESGITPLEYLLTVMRAPEAEPRERMSAAIAAAPYIHAKLSSIEVSGKDGAAIDHSLTVSFVGA